MEQVLVALITGLTTGGLSCLAVQGGLLATSLARQIEQDLSIPLQVSKQRRKKVAPRTNEVLPILLFLFAKLVTYTVLGGLLGLVGSFLTLSPVSRAILLLAIGIFMIGNGLRMLNVHPVFRYFNFEPPRWVTRYIRRKAKAGADLATPLFLGALTVLIPCGVTQAMMAVALGSGSVVMGAALMFAFTLGTSPVFFLVAYLTAQVGKRLESFFLRFVAVVLLVLGLVSLDNGLNLLGSPISLSRLTQNLLPAQAGPGSEQYTSQEWDDRLVLQVANNGYSPRRLYARANADLSLELVTNGTVSCARDFVIPALNYYKLLPTTGRVMVSIPPQEPGTVMRFTCSMGMYTGEIVFGD